MRTACMTAGQPADAQPRRALAGDDAHRRQLGGQPRHHAARSGELPSHLQPTSDRVEADALELGFGAALRPVDWDWLNVLFKFTHVLEMRPISLTDNLSRRRTYDIVSLMPILELPWHLQLVEKIAYKRIEESLDLMPGSTLQQVIHTLLWINRINFHITGRLDAGVEYRLLRMFLEGQGDQLRARRPGRARLLGAPVRAARRRLQLLELHRQRVRRPGPRRIGLLLPRRGPVLITDPAPAWSPALPIAPSVARPLSRAALSSALRRTTSCPPSR